jgi:hypothetical protein
MKIRTLYKEARADLHHVIDHVQRTLSLGMAVSIASSGE